ncbi:LPS biosynthesis protein [Daejeonella oryzae]|uniref:LPS biosynthesis protein n=1 Tax=Daejeonella oryzae TaxID=1122943 RepID=UPI0003FBACB3|nr:LPS biosynthesis protein [Daejeonella oryzae]
MEKNQIDTPNAYSAESNEISLQEVAFKFRVWWDYLISKWMVILSMGLLGGILGLAFAFYKKPEYIAVTTFVLEESGGAAAGGLGQVAGLAALAGIDIGGGGEGIFQGDNIAALYKSRSMLGKALLTEIDVDGNKQLLIDRYIDFMGLRDKWENKPALVNLKFSKAVDQPRTRLQDSVIGEIIEDINKKYLKVEKPDKKLNVIDVSFAAEDEIFAKTFNNTIVSTVNDFYVQTKTKKSLLNIGILQHKTDSVRAVMNGAISSAARVIDATPNLNTTRQAQRVAPVQRSQFTAETNKAILGELVKNLELSKMNFLKEKPLIQVIDEPVYPLKKEKLSKIKLGVMGFFIATVLTVFILIFKRFFKKLGETAQ